MQINVNGTRLWFDVEGPALVPEGSALRQRPTVVLVHGGPGVYDHSYFKPDFGRLAEYTQVIYVDLRGHGRSDWGDAARWSFEICADDIRAFCDALGIERPIVLGHSMGGPIVLLYGARHPGHAAALIVQSGFARWDPPRMVEGFRRVAGDEVAEIARRSYTGEEVPREAWARVFAAFGPRLPDPEREAHVPKNLELNEHGMEIVRRVDIVEQLGGIDAPTLVSVGELDPVTPIACAEEIVEALPDGIAQLDLVDGAGHFTWMDAPDHYWPTIVDFIQDTIEGERLELVRRGASQAWVEGQVTVPRRREDTRLVNARSLQRRHRRDRHRLKGGDRRGADEPGAVHR